MNRLVAVSTAMLMALAPSLDAAQAQGQGSAEHQIEQQASENRQSAKHQSKKQQAGKPQWKRGGRYTGKGTTISDYGRHNLKAPPMGHRWVRDGTDFLLIAIETEIIATVVHGR